MITRRLLYLFCLDAATLFYIFDTGFFSFVLLVLALAFVPMELLVSLPGLLGAQVTLGARQSEVRGGAPITLAISARARFSFCGIKGRLICRNLLDASEKKLRFRLPVGPAQAYEITRYGAAIGAVRFSVQKLRLVDVAGLFAFPLKAPAPVTVLALPTVPQPLPPLPKAVLEAGRRVGSPASPGLDALREFTDIRAYQAGDLPRDVHWKLTAKFDKMMVREGQLFAAGVPLLCFDYHGKATAVAAALGRLEALCSALWGQERPHRVCWLHPDGTHSTHLIDGQGTFDTMMWTILETPLPAEGPSILQHPAGHPGPVLLVKPGGTELYEDGQLREVAQ